MTLHAEFTPLPIRRIMATVRKTRKIGLMGGTFDPIHLGHLFIAEAARVHLGLEKVIFFPNGQPAHAEGKTAVATSEMRWELTNFAIQSNPYFEASRIEIERPGKSFAIETVAQFQRELGDETELFFIVGADSMVDVLTWHRGAELLETCRFVAATRPGFDWEKAKNQLTPRQTSRVEWLQTPGLHIASRDLRQRVKNGEAIRYLVPDEVAQKIEELGLYREENV